MGTRAVYTFIHDADERYSVYKQWDGGPRWSCRFIADALPLAWPLPRFEADEFAAAFVAVNKKEAGDVRLTCGPGVHGDLSYTYEIRCRDGQVHLRIFKVRYHGPAYCWAEYQPLFAGSLEDAQQFASTWDTVELLAEDLHGPKPAQRWQGRIDVAVEGYNREEAIEHFTDLAAHIEKGAVNTTTRATFDAESLRSADPDKTREAEEKQP